MEFSRPEYWSGYPFPSPGDLPDPGIKPRSPTLQADSLPAEPQGKPKNTGVHSLSLLQGIFLTQGSKLGLPLCRQILYNLSYQGNLKNSTHELRELLPCWCFRCTSSRLLQHCVCVKVSQSCPTLCYLCSPPGSSLHGILQARVLEWVAISFSRGSSRPRDQTQVSCIPGGFFTS